jgi:hypothetical protein
MRTVNTELVHEYAERLRPLLPLASKAYGTQRPDSAPRRASDEVNKIILEYADQRGGNMTHLATELEGSISLPGLRRRLRSARGGSLSAEYSFARKRGTKDPEKVEAAAKKIDEARNVNSLAYAQAVREVYAAGISLSAVARALGINYYSLWSAASHN